MRILALHNRYIHRGGEDTAFDSEVSLLRDHGHVVREYVDENARIPRSSAVSVGLQAVWSSQSHAAISAEIQKHRPHLVHVHNFFPLISPAAYYACRAAGVPVVQSLYNPRLLCPAATLYRKGRPCTECVGRIPLPGVLHACYHHSRLQTLAIATMLTVHRTLGTWQRLVSRYLVATKFYRDLMIRGGLPASRIIVKPNFVLTDPGYHPIRKDGTYALFVGRLDPEKGIRTLLDAWRGVPIPLIIRGSGRLENEVRERIAHEGLSQIRIMDQRPKTELIELMKNARFLVWPSEGYYETFGLAAVEAFAAGVPVIASRIGVMEEIVQDRTTGLHFEAGRATDLANKVRWLWDHPTESRRMGANARQEYEYKYTSQNNYEQLMKVYESVMTAPEQ